ncbi:sugar kinase [Mucilaginibacter sp.]|uniref:sugar kinase n=1 Tax=Mucilaginibacter sp. TaxID=1882438 RepID=UPI00283DECF4|nr:sugar kinase [Mucilaginibacter sp.]MDR3695990.1 sugar kinase [Mucilaginibacter sp.]
MSDLLKQEKNGSILSFGELLIRLCPDADGDWLNNNKIPFYIGGAELNAANALALWGLPVKYFTLLPDNSLSAQIIEYLKKMGIDTSQIHYGDGRIGLYYLTTGQDVKHNGLIYDRAGSAFANIKTGVIDWDKVLQNVSWFHFSAICPAIGQNVADVCKEVLEAAEKKGITISVDLNYRSKLWQYGKSPIEIMPELVNYCDLVMGNIWAAETMLGIEITPDIHKSGQKTIYLEESLRTSESILNRFPKCKAVANTFRFDATKDIKYYTTLYVNNQLYNSGEYQTEQVIDKVGSGDCFMAGLIYGFYNTHAADEIIEFATAAAFEKLFINGDATTCTVAEIKNAIKLNLK